MFLNLKKRKIRILEDCAAVSSCTIQIRRRLSAQPPPQ